MNIPKNLTHRKRSRGDLPICPPPFLLRLSRSISFLCALRAAVLRPPEGLPYTVYPLDLLPCPRVAS